MVFYLEKLMVSHRLSEVLTDLQTIAIVVLLYALLREEEANAFLRTWLSENFPLGLYLLSPFTVVAVSATLMTITVGRLVSFVTGRKATPLGNEILLRLNGLRKHLRELASTRGTNFSAFVLTAFGLGLAFYSYFVIGIVPLAALGIACIILGFTTLSLPRRLGGGTALRVMLQGATLSVEALLGPSGVGRAIYLPPAGDGVISAYLPLNGKAENLSLEEMRRAPRSLVKEDQRGLLVYPVGSEFSKIPEFQDGFSLEDGLKYILVESTDICSRVMAEETGNTIVVGMKNAETDVQGQRYQDSLGSLPSSLAACVIATLHDRPVTLLEERRSGDRLIARFRLLA
jgi:hypothetical protein